MREEPGFDLSPAVRLPLILAALDGVAGTALEGAGLPRALASLAGFVAAFAVLALRPAWPGPGVLPARAARAGALLLLGAVGLSVKVGVASSLRVGGAPAWLETVGGAAAGWGLILVGGVAARLAAPTQGGRRRWTPIVVASTAAGVLLRLAWLAPIPLLYEEAYHWLYAWHLDIGYLDHGPMVAWLGWASTHAFGGAEFGVRFGSFLLWLATAALLFALARRTFDRRTAWTAVALLALLPYSFAHGMILLPDVPLLFAWTGFTYAFHRAVIGGERRGMVLAGMFLGVGLLSKLSILLLGLAAVSWLVVDPRSRPWLGRGATWLAVLLAVLLASPHLAWNVENDWASFAYQSSRRMEMRFRFQLPAFAAFVVLILTPLGLGGVIGTAKAWWRGRRGGERGTTAARGRALALWLALVPFVVLAAASCIRPTRFNWTGPLWVPLLPWIADWAWRGTDVLRPIARWTGGVLLAAWALGLLHLGAGLPLLPLPPNVGGRGWPEMGALLEARVDRIGAEEGRRPLVVGMDVNEVASWASYYRWRAAADPRAAVDETVGRHLLGLESRMFARWHPLERVPRGAPLLLVASERKQIDAPWIEARVERLGPVEEIRVERDGEHLGTWLLRRAWGWTPPPASGAADR